jgi:putative tryptophan/tyrosine transport system substrate-binding protein
VQQPKMPASCVAYRPDRIDNSTARPAISKGEKPPDVPLQAPRKYELLINLKSAKTLRIEVPLALFARADEVIE